MLNTMKITDYNYRNNQILKIRKTTITVKNRDTMKTVGVIRGVETYEHMKKSRSLYLQDSLEKLFKIDENDYYGYAYIEKMMPECVIIDEKIYYMYNIKPYLFCQEYKKMLHCTLEYKKREIEYETINTIQEYIRANKISKYIDVIEYIPDFSK